MNYYSLSDLLLVWFAGMLTGSFLVYLLCGFRRNPLSKEDAKMVRHVLSYCELNFKQMFRNGFPIENNPALSVRFATWPAVNVFVKRMMDMFREWK